MRISEEALTRARDNSLRRKSGRIEKKMEVKFVGASLSLDE